MGEEPQSQSSVSSLGEESQSQSSVSSFKEEQQNQSSVSSFKEEQQSQSSVSSFKEEQQSLLKTQQSIEKFSQNKINSHKPYSSFSNLSLYLMNFSYFINFEDTSLYNFSADFLFSDPLEFNKLLLYSSIGKYEKLFQLSYLYEKHRPFLSFSFVYDEGYLEAKKDKYTIATFKDLGFLEIEDIYNFYPNSILRKKIYIPYKDRAFDFSFEYPLLIKPDWSLFFISEFKAGQKQFNRMDWKNYINHAASLNYAFKKKYSYSYSFSRRRFVKLSYNMLHLKPDSKTYNSYLTGSLQAYLTEEIGKEWFITLSAMGKRKLWDKEPKKLFFHTDSSDVFFSYSSLKQSVQNVYKLNFQILKVLNHSRYFLKIPFAIRRWAPLTGLSFLSFKEENTKYKYLLAPFVGVESELNFLYEKAIFKVGISGAYVFDLLNVRNQSTFQASTWLKTSF